MLVDKEDVVQEGQLLATMRAPELTQDVQKAAADRGGRRRTDLGSRLRMAAARADRDAADAEISRTQALASEARANVEEARSNLNLARVTWRRLKNVFDSDAGLLARQDLDVATARVQEDEARLAASQQALQAAEQAVGAARSKSVAAARQTDALAAQYQHAAWQRQSAQAAASRSQSIQSYAEIHAPFPSTITARLLDPAPWCRVPKAGRRAKPARSFRWLTSG